MSARRRAVGCPAEAAGWDGLRQMRLAGLPGTGKPTLSLTGNGGTFLLIEGRDTRR